MINFLHYAVILPMDFVMTVRRDKLEEMPQKVLLRPAEVARFFSVSVKTVYGWIAEGKLEGKKICGSTLRIKREDVDKIIKSSLE